MRIGAFIPQSLIDWPGRTVAVVFTKGCNFRCFYCHNLELIYPELYNQTEDIAIEKIMALLQRRKNWLDGVVITGGEPTLQPDLEAFIQELATARFDVKLDTNGSNPEMLENLLRKNLLTAVAMDIKTHLLPVDYQHVCQTSPPVDIEPILQSISLLKSSKLEIRFRTTVVPKYHNENILQTIRQQIAPHPLYLQDFRPLP